MRRLIIYEFRKLLSPLIIITTALLLLLNSFLLFSDSSKAVKANGGLDTATLDAIYEQYFNDPDVLISYYDELVAFEKAQRDAMTEAYLNGTEYVRQEREGEYIKSDYKQDMKMIERVMAAAEEVRSYPADINTVIRNTYINRAAYLERGYTEQSWYYRNQVHNAEIYTAVRDRVVMGFEYVHGWGTLLESSYSSIFVFFTMLLVSATVFTKESVSGMLPIIHTTRRGRLTTGLAKLAVTVSCSGALVLLFAASSYLTVLLTEGFSSSYNALQVLESFRFAPYAITLGEYFILSELVRFLAVCVFSLAVGAISILFYNYVLTYAAGMAVLGLNFMAFSAETEGELLISYLNFISVANGKLLFQRLRTVDLFGGVFDYLTLALLIYGVLAAGLPALCELGWCRRKTGLQIRWFKKVLSAVRKKLAPAERRRLYKLRFRHMTPASAELHKMLVSSRLWILVVLLLVVRLGVLASGVEEYKGRDEYIYRNYLLRFEGVVTEQKIDEVQNELDRINAIIAQKDQKEADYTQGKLSNSEYFNYLSSYNNAVDDKRVVEKILSDGQRKLKTNQKSDAGLWLVYDTGWQAVFGQSPDYFCYALILLLTVGVFAGEYSDRSGGFGFSQILRTCCRGRARTWLAKFGMSVSVSATLTLICVGTDVLILRNNYKLPAHTAPLGSLSNFSGAEGMSIGQYLVFYIAARVAVSILLALFVTALSQLTRRTLVTVTVTAGVTLLPAMLTVFGVTRARFFSCIHLMQVSELFADGIQKQMLGRDIGLFVIGGGAFALIAAVCLAASAIRWCGIRPIGRSKAN